MRGPQKLINTTRRILWDTMGPGWMVKVKALQPFIARLATYFAGKRHLRIRSFSDQMIASASNPGHSESITFM